MQELSQSQWALSIADDENAVILDVRTDMELEQGMIPEALHIDIMNASHFMENVKRLDPDKNYYIYCRSGARSAQACMIMNSLGYPNTFNLMGGILEWEGKTV